MKKMARSGPTTGRKITAELSLDDILTALGGYHQDVRRKIQGEETYERYKQAWSGGKPELPRKRQRTWSVLISEFRWGKTPDDVVIRVQFKHGDEGHYLSYNLKTQEGIGTLPFNCALPLV